MVGRVQNAAAALTLVVTATVLSVACSWKVEPPGTAIVPAPTIGQETNESSACGEGNSPTCSSWREYVVGVEELCPFAEELSVEFLSKGAPEDKVGELIALCISPFSITDYESWLWEENSRLSWSVVFVPEGGSSVKATIAADATGGPL